MQRQSHRHYFTVGLQMSIKSPMSWIHRNCPQLQKVDHNADGCIWNTESD